MRIFANIREEFVLISDLYYHVFDYTQKSA